MNKTPVTTFDASEAKNNFGRLLEASQRQPVSIKKHGRHVAFVISPADMHAMEDMYLGAKAKKIVGESTPIGTNESEAYLEDILHAQD
tara:strand:+ start:28186 stop:28449 length:264 start_codon:yes stop_codon:yes gene_type:complete